MLYQKGPDEATLAQVNDVTRAYRDDVHRDTGPFDLLERSLHLRVTTYTHDPTKLFSFHSPIIQMQDK